MNSSKYGFREYERSTTTTKSCLALQIFVSAWPAGQSSFSTATPTMAAGRSSHLSTPRICLQSLPAMACWGKLEVWGGAAEDADYDGVLMHDGREYPAKAGVSHIWVDRACRRAGTARALLDACRRHFAMGFSLPVAQLAFSQPTTAGRRLAVAYTGREDFLVYE